ncbi:MAG: type II toxin-antitoxin system VapB family antitoxin [Gaiella sp.]|nr:type II toxin-antitoxin system VapB family antitoxin [Gaiella sp.]
MKTSIDIDRELSDEVAELLGTRTLKETVHQALLEARGAVLRRRLTQRVLDGTLPVPTQEEYEELRRPRVPVGALSTPPKKRRPTA